MSIRASWLVLLLAVGAPAPAEAAEPMRVAVGEGVRSVDVAGGDLVTVRDVAARRNLFGIPGGRVIRVTPGGSGLDLVWGTAPRDRRRVTMSAIRLTARRGPLASGAREYGGALEIWRIGERCSSSTRWRWRSTWRAPSGRRRPSAGPSSRCARWRSWPARTRSSTSRRTATSLPTW